MPGRGERIEGRLALRPQIARWLILGLAAIGILVLSMSVLLSIRYNLELCWTSIRLAPAFALAHGIPLYSTPDKGPWVMVGYGPLYPFTYLPSVLARDPRTAVTAATLLAHFFVLAPAGLILSLLGKREGGGRTAGPVPWLLLLLLFASITQLVRSMLYVTTLVHADAPAIGLFLVACYAVLCAGRPGAANVRRWLLCGGVAAGFSAACKMNFAGVTVALVIWVVRFFGWKRAAEFLIASFLAVITVYALAAWRDGLSAVVLNLREPGRMPWWSGTGTTYDSSEKIRTFLGFCRSYFQFYGPVALAIIFALTLFREKNTGADGDRRVAWLFVFVAAVLMPASVASLSKYGGDVNSCALVSLPLTLAAIAAFTSIAQSGHRVATVVFHAALAGAILLVALSWKDRRLPSRKAPTLVEAHAAILAEPGRWYFPYDPLAHLLAEGKFRPNMDVIYSYALSDFPVDAAAFQAALPEDLRYIAIPPAAGTWGATEIRRLLPAYTSPSPELSTDRHRVYSR